MPTPPGVTMTLPGSSPAASRCIVGSTWSRRDVDRLDQQVEGEGARREQLERGAEPGRVVVVRADDRLLHDDHAVVVDARRRAAGADEHERARVVELVERRLRRRAVARALEHDGERRLDRSAHRRARQLVGRDDRGRADGERALAPRRCRFGDDDVVHAAAAEHRGGEETDRVRRR